MKPALRTLFPLISGVLILASAGVMIHLYRSTYSSTPWVKPALPRAQFSFTLALPENRSEEARTFLLRVVKNRGSLLSVNYWPSGRTVFQVPVLDIPSSGKSGHSVRLALWDPGSYTISFTDMTTGAPVKSLSLRVASPLGLYRNDLILLAVLAVAAYFSGKMARSSWSGDPLSLPATASRVLFSSRGRVLLFSGILLAGLAAMAFSGLSRAPALLPGLPHEGFHESEGRPDAPEMTLPVVSGLLPSGSSGLLVIRHRLDSWLRFGQDLTLFDGPVTLASGQRSFLLPPDDGRYRLTLWEDRTRTLSETRRTLRALPVSPPFPTILFSGLTLFSGAFFILGLLGSTRKVSVRPQESVH